MAARPPAPRDDTEMGLPERKARYDHWMAYLNTRQNIFPRTLHAREALGMAVFQDDEGAFWHVLLSDWDMPVRRIEAPEGRLGQLRQLDSQYGLLHVHQGQQEKQIFLNCDGTLAHQRDADVGAGNCHLDNQLHSIEQKGNELLAINILKGSSTRSISLGDTAMGLSWLSNSVPGFAALGVNSSRTSVVCVDAGFKDAKEIELSPYLSQVQKAFVYKQRLFALGQDDDGNSCLVEIEPAEARVKSRASAPPNSRSL